MNDETAEKHGAPGWVKASLVALLAVLVLGTGAVLLPPAEGPEPEPPFSETARAAAYEDTVTLAAEAARAGSPAATVTLLETQARALLAPDPTATAPSSGTATPASKSTFLSGLSRSAAQRLADAGKSDGGPARLLAAVGTAQHLESVRLAKAWSLPVPATPLPSAAASVPAAPTPEPSCTAAAGAVSPSAASPAASSQGPAAAATTADALAAVVGAEQKAVYLYQVALTRLEGASAAAAASDLEQHQLLLREAEALARQQCAKVPPREAGYQLPAGFASQAQATLAEQETAALPAYGELVALSDGATRRWAMAGLFDSARRLEAMGSPPGALPGLSVDPAALPPLPQASASPLP
ncbi:DUF4439 domain-containing protein [Arthrobacter sp. SW1]|uniref:DUF4439 domain-containing protein n=1 Tax=Arthrobacter sp. SW1 TaxID=1920889 RepID=UPI00209B3E21|nr:DUF4439 domain-containing protein [Arthrobacter sp. SW1]